MNNLERHYARGGELDAYIDAKFNAGLTVLYTQRKVELLKIFGWDTMNNINWYCDEPVINIDTDEKLKELRHAAESGGSLFWHHLGMAGRVSNAILMDTWRLMVDWQDFRRRHPDIKTPDNIGEIWWDQTTFTLKPENTR